MRIGLHVGRSGRRGAAPTGRPTGVCGRGAARRSVDPRPAANAAGGLCPSDECGRWWSYSCRHDADRALASRRSVNTSAFSSSSRGREWKPSAHPFSPGLPRAMYRLATPVSSTSRVIVRAMNSGPLSEQMGLAEPPRARQSALPGTQSAEPARTPASPSPIAPLHPPVTRPTPRPPSAPRAGGARCGSARGPRPGAPACRWGRPGGCPGGRCGAGWP